MWPRPGAPRRGGDAVRAGRQKQAQARGDGCRRAVAVGLPPGRSSPHPSSSQCPLSNGEAGEQGQGRKGQRTDAENVQGWHRVNLAKADFVAKLVLGFQGSPGLRVEAEGLSARFQARTRAGASQAAFVLRFSCSARSGDLPILMNVALGHVFQLLRILRFLIKFLANTNHTAHSCIYLHEHIQSLPKVCD